MDKILEIKNLNKGFDDFQLKNISLSVPTGTIVGLIGENGTGKSTIINLIENLLKEDSGEIYVFGENMRENEKRLKQKWELFMILVIIMKSLNVRISKI